MERLHLSPGSDVIREIPRWTRPNLLYKLCQASHHALGKLTREFLSESERVHPFYPGSGIQTAVSQHALKGHLDRSPLRTGVTCGSDGISGFWMHKLPARNTTRYQWPALTIQYIYCSVGPNSPARTRSIYSPTQSTNGME